MPEQVSLPGYSSSNALASNAAGQEIGISNQNISSANYGAEAGWFYSNGQFTAFPYFASTPTAINASGQVAGFYSNDVNGHPNAFLFQYGHITELGTLGGANAAALGLNNQGQVVGWSFIAGSPLVPNSSQLSNAFIYENGTMYNLNLLLNSGAPPIVLTGALAINNLGQILAVAQDSHDYILTPSDLAPPPAPAAIPECSTLAFAGLAIAVIERSTHSQASEAADSPTDVLSDHGPFLVADSRSFLLFFSTSS